MRLTAGGGNADGVRDGHATRAATAVLPMRISQPAHQTAPPLPQSITGAQQQQAKAPRAASPATRRRSASPASATAAAGSAAAAAAPKGSPRAGDKRPPPTAAAAAASSDECENPRDQRAQQQEQQQQQPKQQQQQQQNGAAAGGGKAKKRARTDGDLVPFVGAVHQAAKKGSASEALEVYERAKARGLALRPAELSSVMQVCAGSGAWEAAVRRAHVERLRRRRQEGQQQQGEEEALEAFLTCHIPPPATQTSGGGGGGGGAAADGKEQQQQQQGDKEKEGGGAKPGRPKKPTIIELEGWQVRERGADEVLAAVEGIWADMQAGGVAPTETVYTSLARAAAARGDADAALAWAEQVAAAEAASGGAKMVARLRTYQPALVALALAGRAADALAVAERLAAMAAAGGRDYLDLTEAEHALTLEAVARGGDYAQFASVLRRMRADLNELRPATLDLAARFFASPDAAEGAFGPGGEMAGRGSGWAPVRWVRVAADGAVAEAGGERLQMFDLEEAEWGVFADAIAGLAKRHERRDNAFEEFQQWLER